MQLFLISLLAGTAAALAALWIARRFGATNQMSGPMEPVRFLFRGQQLVDATGPARRIIAQAKGASDWARVTGWLGMRFGAGAAAVLHDAEHGSFTTADGAELQVEKLGEGHLRITLSDPNHADGGLVVEPLAQAALLSEVEMLRRSVDSTPMLSWAENSDQEVTWANAAYLELAEALCPDHTMWPLPRLLNVAAPPEDGAPLRASLQVDGREMWFDCTAKSGPDGMMYCALPADKTVRAERSLREFVQTLTKTFADLPIGLAIFDKQRRLQLFNPALIDLTGLATGFLTARPTLYALLDRLREARMVPEPKDYRSWRRQIATLEAAAASGHHVETWSLPGGQTYRVTGRPHPDGAVAFLFEDITSEISRTRRFKSELSLGMQLMDSLDDAIAVVGPGGRVEMANRAWRELWPECGEDVATVQTCWQQQIEDPEAREALNNGLAGADMDRQHEGLVILSDGRSLRWSASAMPGGRRMLSFSERINRAGSLPIRRKLPRALPA